MNIWRTLSSLEFLDTRIYQYRGKSVVQYLSPTPPALMLFPGTPDYVAQFDSNSWIAYDYIRPLDDIIGLDVEVEARPDDFGIDGRGKRAPHYLMSNDVAWHIYFSNLKLKAKFWNIVMNVSLDDLILGNWMKIRWRWNAFGQSILYLNDQPKVIKSNVYPNILMPMPSFHVGGGSRHGPSLNHPFRGHIRRAKVSVLTRKMRDLAIGNGLCILPMFKEEVSPEDLQRLSEWSYKLKRLEDEVRKMLAEYLRLRKTRPGRSRIIGGELIRGLKIHTQAKEMAGRSILCPPKENASEEYKIRLKMIIDFLKELKRKNPKKFCDDLGGLIKRAEQLLQGLPTLKLRTAEEIISPEAQEFLKLFGEEIKRLCSNDGGR